ncbi:hypothetical protein H0H87_006826 [Tephrocybe sp. NHM501043]|nr:hypothetical protein H0H87_006826 [Tephrocybe sp. NHM501043]
MHPKKWFVKKKQASLALSRSSPSPNTKMKLKSHSGTPIEKSFRLENAEFGPSEREEDNDAYAKVENTLFKVPRPYFEHASPVFRDMFSLPRGTHREGSQTYSEEEGATKEHPIHLGGILKADFLSFLKVICPKYAERETLSVVNWISVLKLSTMWDFEVARDLAIRALTTCDMSPVERIEQTRVFGVDQWYWLALGQLAVAPQNPSTDETDRLGMEFSLRLAELRGRIAGFKSGARKQFEEDKQVIKNWGGKSTSDPVGPPTVKLIAKVFPAEVAAVPFHKCDELLRNSCKF